MDYFTLLNLKREPFSNSPDPDNFYPSYQHVSCMQKLELAIRMRRGLNIVTGRVGTGKTTLCRQLIRKLSSNDDILLYLILDPSFSTVREMLSGVVRLLTGKEADPDATEWQLKETIKSFLFQQAAEEGKIVVLIIDEGQKLADYSLETLREFLNYETNEKKLLQIIIFAQNEFDDILLRQHNFNDRINTRINIGGLSFNQTRKLIHHRLARAAGEQKPPVSFSLSACRRIYRLSGGYPRQIINLCHQSLLAMIIRNRKKVTSRMVMAGAASLSYSSRRTLVRPVFPAILLAVSVLLIPLFPWEMPADTTSNVITSSVIPAPRTQPAVQPAVALSQEQEKGPVSGSAAPFTVPEARADITPPSHLGTLRVQPNETLSSLMRLVYGPYSFNDRNLTAVLNENPHLTDPDHIEVGKEITFPYLYNPSRPLSSASWLIVLNRPASFEGAVDFLAKVRKAGIPGRLVYDWKPEQGEIRTVVYDKSFDDRPDADRIRAGLPVDLKEDAQVVTGLQSRYWTADRRDLR